MGEVSHIFPLYLGLGTNLGDKCANLRRVLTLLDEAFNTHWTALSDFIETEPWGFESDEKFLNAVVRYDINVPQGTSAQDIAHKILTICKSTEKRMGREPVLEYGTQGNRVYHSRIIDIDILLFGDLQVNDEDLKIPHPRMRERNFVMVPLLQIAPHFAVQQNFHAQ